MRVLDIIITYWMEIRELHLLFNWKIKRGNRVIDLTSEDPTYSDIYYDLENKTFTFSSRSKKP